MIAQHERYEQLFYNQKIIVATAPLLQWVHLATTWKPNGNFKLYINGELKVSETPLLLLYTNDIGEIRTLRIGDPNLPNEYGTIFAVDELKVFTT